MDSALYSGQVTHQRLRPRRHRLSYGVFQLLLDLDELPGLAQRLRCFSLNRFNLFALRESDYGDGCANGLRAYVDAQLRAAGLPTGGRVRLLTMPRVLGHAFNPLSVYFCHHPDGALMALLYEVSNTFGERHSYLIPTAPGPAGATVDQRCDKRLFVSPFLGMQMHYQFHLRPPEYGDTATGSPLLVRVDAHDHSGPVVLATLRATRQALSDTALLRTLFTHPLLTLKVVAAIHWEALRLWLRGVGLHLHDRPAAPAQPVSIVTPAHHEQP
jgi:hypothetical protein